jgi:hypothetical protein
LYLFGKVLEVNLAGYEKLFELHNWYKTFVFKEKFDVIIGRFVILFFCYY